MAPNRGHDCPKEVLKTDRRTVTETRPTGAALRAAPTGAPKNTKQKAATTKTQTIEDVTAPVHGTKPAGNTPAPPYYHPPETEPDAAEQRETNARGKALAIAALQQPVDPDWDNLPIRTPALPTDTEQATA
jgi:hypothetical protein